MQALSLTKFKTTLNAQQLQQISYPFMIEQTLFAEKDPAQDASDNVLFGILLVSPSGSAPHYSQLANVQ